MQWPEMHHMDLGEHMDMQGMTRDKGFKCGLSKCGALQSPETGRYPAKKKLHLLFLNTLL